MITYSEHIEVVKTTPEELQKFTTQTTIRKKIGKQEKQVSKDKKPKKEKLPKSVTHPVLPCSYKTYARVDYKDFDEFVNKVYKLNFDFVLHEECSNGTDHSFPNVTGKIAESDWEDADKLRKGEKPDWFSTGLLLDCLCADGYLPPGNYLIEVFW